MPSDGTNVRFLKFSNPPSNIYKNLPKAAHLHKHCIHTLSDCIISENVKCSKPDISLFQQTHYGFAETTSGSIWVPFHK